MILSEQQEKILKTLRADKQYNTARALAKEMLIVKYFNLSAEEFEEDEDYREAMKCDYEYMKIVKHYLKQSIEVYPLDEDGEPNGFSDFDTFGFIGNDNKFYDNYFCEIPLKDFKKQYGVTKKQLLAINDVDNWFVLTKTDEAIELGEDLYIHFANNPMDYMIEYEI